MHQLRKFIIMKKVNKIITTIFLFSFHCTYAEKKDTVYTQSTLTTSTVYYGGGAQLNHTCKTFLFKGIQEIVINNVSLIIDANTLRISCPENVTLLAYSHRTTNVHPVAHQSDNYSKIYDSIKYFQKQILYLKNKVDLNNNIISRLTSLIENNFTTPDKRNINSEELIKLSNYYTDKITTLKNLNYDLAEKEDIYNNIILELNKKLDNVDDDKNSNLNKVQGQIVLQVLVKENGISAFDFNYFTRNAAWIPAYEIRVKSIDNSFRLLYKAQLNQSTGLNWNNIKLNLSTSNPNLSNVIPSIYPTYLQFYAPVLYSAISNRIEKYNSAAPVMRDLTISNGELLQTKLNIQTDDVSENLTLAESELNINYEIDLPYEIPSDSKSYSINIKEETMKVIYQHFAIPKIDNDAYLLAKLTRWDSLNLLPGEANIIMDNIYIGKSFLNPSIAQDTLEISLGRDKRISIERKVVKECTIEKKRDYKLDIFTYEIIVKNNKKNSVEINLKDQFPISKTNEIEVILLDNKNAVVDTEKGIIAWKEKIESGESRKYRFSYQVKYPKIKVLQEVK